MMEKNTTIMVYKDPITKLKPEGRATLRSPIILPDSEIQDMERLEYWKVEFEDEPGRLFQRWVTKK